jgi:hypothetical protein
LRERSRTAALSLLAASILVAILVGEGLTRAFSPFLFDLSNPLFRFEPELGWLYRSGEIGVRRNEAGESVDLAGDPLGLRRPPHPFDPEAEPVVLVVGDSFTSGTQLPVEAAWPAGIEARLRPGEPRLEVVNAGVDGYDLAQEFHLARRLWSRFHPRVLVVGMYVGNDIVDYETQAQAAPPWAGPFRRLSDHSYLSHFLRGSLTVIEGRTRNRRKDVPLAQWDPRTLPGFQDLPPAEQDRVRGQFASPELVPVLRGGPEGDRRLETTERVLVALAELASSQGGHLLVVLIPTKQQVVEVERREWKRVLGLPEDALDVPQHKLARFARGAGIDLVDAEPAFVRSPDPAALFWRVDMHLTRAGHRTVADTVAPLVAEALAPGK